MRNLIDLRLDVGLSQAEVGRRMGVGQSQVSKIEAMYPDLMLPRLLAYCEALGVDIRFISPDGINVSASDVEEDTSRSYKQGRQNDPTRGGAKAA